MNLTKIEEETTKDLDEERNMKKIKLDNGGNTISRNGSGTGSFSLSLDCSSIATENNTDIDISKMCCNVQPIESTRLSSLSTNDEPSFSRTSFNHSYFKTVISDDEASKVSIISQLVNLILTIHSDLRKLSSDENHNFRVGGGGDKTVMRAVCCMKTVKDLTSTLCTVHEVVGLNDLKVMSHAFKREVNDMWIYVKEIVLNRSRSNHVDFENKILRLLESTGQLSLAAIDHIKIGKDDFYIDRQFIGELSIHFIRCQNRFLITKLGETKFSVEGGIEEMKKLQLSSTHEMSEDLVDGVMSVLTSFIALFQQCEYLSVVYLKSVEESSGQCLADECHHLRSILTDIIDYNENIVLIIEKSKLVSKDSDSLAEFLDVPVILADITKSICKSATDLLTYIASHKSLSEDMVDALYESLENFVFSGKTARVSITMLIQEIERDLDISENQSILPYVTSDTSFGKREPLCPVDTNMNHTIPLDTSIAYKHNRSSVGQSEQYVSRYMGL